MRECEFSLDLLLHQSNGTQQQGAAAGGSADGGGGGGGVSKLLAAAPGTEAQVGPGAWALSDRATLCLCYRTLLLFVSCFVAAALETKLLLCAGPCAPRFRIGTCGRHLPPTAHHLHPAQGGAGGRSVDAIVNGSITSPNCGLALGLNASTTHIEAYYAKAVNYTAMITLLAFVQVGGRAAGGRVVVVCEGQGSWAWARGWGWTCYCVGDGRGGE